MIEFSGIEFEFQKKKKCSTLEKMGQKVLAVERTRQIKIFF